MTSALLPQLSYTLTSSYALTPDDFQETNAEKFDGEDELTVADGMDPRPPTTCSQSLDPRDCNSNTDGCSWIGGQCQAADDDDVAISPYTRTRQLLYPFFADTKMPAIGRGIIDWPGVTDDAAANNDENDNDEDDDDRDTTVQLELKKLKEKKKPPMKKTRNGSRGRANPKTGKRSIKRSSTRRANHKKN